MGGHCSLSPFFPLPLLSLLLFSPLPPPLSFPSSPFLSRPLLFLPPTFFSLLPLLSLL